jgi:shikimate kinase
VAETRRVDNLVLVGFMGTGKSSVGRVVARHLRFAFCDTDELVEARSHKRIAEIFAEQGESVFREYERQVVADIALQQGAVISTGGGLGADPSNLALLKQHSLVICLWASPETIWRRVRNQSHRPLLREADPLDKIQRLLAERKPFYLQSDVLVNTERRSVQEVAQQVLHQFHLARRGLK